MTALSLPQVNKAAGLQRTGIEWCNYSFNPLRAINKTNGEAGWFCTKVSEGCRNCYAEGVNRRFGTGLEFSAQNEDYVQVVVDLDRIHRALLQRTPAGSRCFICDMTDLFHHQVTDEQIDLIFAMMAMRSDVTFLVLTKRPERMVKYFTDADERGLAISNALGTLLDGGWIWQQGAKLRDQIERLITWSSGFEPPAPGEDPTPDSDNLQYATAPFLPLPNVWLGTSIENEEDYRVYQLLAVPAAKRFISYEPAIGPWTFLGRGEMDRGDTREGFEFDITGMAWSESNIQYERLKPPGIDWIIVGGESGTKARPFQPAWARRIIEDCRTTGIACFVKQMGRKIQIPNDSLSEWPDGLTHQAPGYGYEQLGAPGKLITVMTEDTKGGNMDEWPEDLRVREFPE